MRTPVKFLIFCLFLVQPQLLLAEEECVLDLAQLLQSATAQDGRVLAAHAQVDVYRAKLDEARALWFPQAKLRVLFGYPVGERRLVCNQPGGAALDPNCVQLANNWRGIFSDDWGNTSFAVGGKLEALQPLYTFGKIENAKDAARAGVDASLAGIEKARQEVALEVRRAYWGCMLADGALAVLQDGKNKLEEAEKKLKQMLEDLNEEVTDKDLFKLRYQATRLEDMILEAEKGRALAMSALAFLANREDLKNGCRLAEAELNPGPTPQLTREAYLEQALARRPEWKMLNAARAASHANVRVHQSFLWPDLFLGASVEGSYSPVHDRIDNPLLNHSLTYWDASLAFGLQWNLDIPQKLARLEQAEATNRGLEAQAEQARRALGLEIDKHLETLIGATRHADNQKKGLRAAKAWMRSNWMSYGVGLSDTEDLLASLAATALSDIEVRKAYYDLRIAQDQLRLAAGESLAVDESPPLPAVEATSNRDDE